MNVFRQLTGATSGPTRNPRRTDYRIAYLRGMVGSLGWLLTVG